MGISCPDSDISDRLYHCGIRNRHGYLVRDEQQNRREMQKSMKPNKLMILILLFLCHTFILLDKIYHFQIQPFQSDMLSKELGGLKKGFVWF